MEVMKLLVLNVQEILSLKITIHPKNHKSTNVKSVSIRYAFNITWISTNVFVNAVIAKTSLQLTFWVWMFQFVRFVKGNIVAVAKLYQLNFAVVYADSVHN